MLDNEGENDEDDEEEDEDAVDQNVETKREEKKGMPCRLWSWQHFEFLFSYLFHRH